MRKRTSPIWLAEPKEFANVVSESKTYVEVLRRFGLPTQGNNSTTVKLRIKEDGLSTEHFNANLIKTRLLHKKKPLQDILVKNSTFDRRTLKKRLIEEHIIPYICLSCGNLGEWNGKKLVLHLEHKNGVNNDNRIENLCFLCPNCHSQTDTYAGKNNKKKYYCIDCQVPITGTGKTGKCTGCANVHPRNTRRVERPTREKLVKQVDELGYSATGRLYGVSDNAIRKWLKSYQT